VRDTTLAPNAGASSASNGAVPPAADHAGSRPEIADHAADTAEIPPLWMVPEEGPRALVHDVSVLARRADSALQRPDPPEWMPCFAIVVLLGLLLGFCGAYGDAALLVAIAITQAVAIVSWVYGTQLIGRKGALVLGVMAAAASDVCVWVWPQSRLGALLGVFALAIPVLFAYQLARGVARHNVVASLSAIGALVIVAIGPAALLQLRHEFSDQTSASRVVGSVVAIMTGGLALSLLVDAISSYPRFDASVPRGVMGVIASTGLGATIGYLALQSPTRHDFSNGRGALAGAMLGALIALLSVAASFAAHSVQRLAGAHQTLARWSRVALLAVVPIALVAPVAFLICVGVRA
jgi:hypothetical protein